MGNIFGSDTVRLDGLESEQRIMEREKFYMGLVHDYMNELVFLSSILEKTRNERVEFFKDTLPKIKKFIESDGVSDTIAEEWLRALEENMRNSFNMSDELIRHYFTKNLEEFMKKYEESEGKR